MKNKETASSCSEIVIPEDKALDATSGKELTARIKRIFEICETHGSRGQEAELREFLVMLSLSSLEREVVEAAVVRRKALLASPAGDGYYIPPALFPSVHGEDVAVDALIEVREKNKNRG